jgi:hypothetical protein
MLFNSGSDNTFIHQDAIPLGALSCVINQRQGQMLAGIVQTSQEVDLQEILLPKFSQSCCIDSQHTFVFTGQCNYDIIFCCDFLQKIGMKHGFDTGNMTAFNITIEMKQKSFYSNPFAVLAKIQESQEEQDDECFHSTQLQQSKYSKADIATVTKQQTHLTTEQQAELQAVLGKHTTLFPGKLSCYRHKKMNLELLAGAKPVHAKPYPVPRTQREVFQKELQCLVQLSVLSRVGGAVWASPSFIIPKKD